MQSSVDSRQQPPRTGFTLVELMVVISILSIVTTLGITTITWLYSIEQTTEDRADTSANWSRLEQDFRNDVHAATKAELVPPSESGSLELRLEQPSETMVVYRATEEQVVREVKQSFATVARQNYHLPNGTVRFSQDPKLPLIRVNYAFTRQPSTQAPVPKFTPTQTHTIEALLGTPTPTP